MLHTNRKRPCMPCHSFATHRVFPPQLDRRPERGGRFSRSPRRDQASQNCSGSTQSARDTVCAAVCLRPSGSCLLLSWAIWAVHGATETLPPSTSGFPLLCFRRVPSASQWPRPSQAPPTGSQAARGGGVASCENHTNSSTTDKIYSTPHSRNRTSLSLLPLSPALCPEWLTWVMFILMFSYLRRFGGQGSTRSPLRLHTRSLMLNFYESGHANGGRGTG